jgi:hypothetical protein
MKKFLPVCLLSLAVLIVSASPKAASTLSACLWYLANGTLTADAAPDPGEPALAVNVGTNPVFEIGQDGWTFTSGGFWSQLSDGSYITADPTYFGLVGPSGRGVVFQPQSNATPFVFDTENDHAFGALMRVGNQGFAKFTVYHDGSIVTDNSDRWKLGTVIPATVQLVTDKYVRVEIAGQIVKLAVVE